MADKGLPCVWAQHGLGLHNSGRAYLCCHSRQYLQDSMGQEIYMDTHTPQDAWSSPTRRNIQIALEQGIQHPNCEACWADERAGKKSRRQHANEMFPSLAPQHDRPQLLDLKLGNTCNMRCRTCNPEVSSQWYRDDWQVRARQQEGIDYPTYLRRWKKITASYSDRNDDLWQTLKQWAPDCVYIDYYGAEPMLIEKNFEVLQHVVDQGKSQHTTLHFSTNGTVYSQEIEDLLSRFKCVYFDLSIDDIGDRCGYIRYPSQWSQVEASLDRFVLSVKRHRHFHLSICVTINSLNIYYLDEIFDYFIRRDLSVNFNILHLPWHLNIMTLPMAVKQIIKEKIIKYQPPNEPRFGIKLQQWRSNRDAVLDYMMNETDGQQRYWQEFEHYLTQLDQVRQQDFKQALPEFAAVIHPWLVGSV